MKKGVQFAVLLAALVGVVWLAIHFWPVHADQEVVLLMFDQVAQPGETVRLTAMLRRPDGAPASGFTVQFFGPPAINQQAKTDATGLASVEVKAPADAGEMFKLKVSCLGDRRHKPTETMGTLHIWPPDASIIVLTEMGSLAAKLNARDAIGQSHRILYVVAGDDPGDAGAMKAALQHASMPAYPVLTARRLAPNDPAQARQAFLSVLKERFPKLAGIFVGEPDTAKHYLPSPAPVYVVGDPAKVTPPAGVTLLKDWEALRKKLCNEPR